jgi:glutamine synthetase
MLARAEKDEISELWVLCHDLNGRAQVRSVAREAFRSAVTNGVSFARANFDFNRLDHQVPDIVFGAETGDFMAVPDPGTYTRIPYHPAAGRVNSFLHEAGGEPWAGCARRMLSRVMDRLTAKGLSVQAAFEPECYLLTRSADRYEPASTGRMFTLDALDSRRDLMSDVIKTLREMGVILEQVSPEYGPGQFEINIRHAAPLKAADDLTTTKETLRALARRAGLIATFMPKLYPDVAGCGMHVHIGLERTDGSNAMAGDGAVGLSPLGLSFVAGLLKHAHGLSGLGSPSVNSYKRLFPGSWAPSHVCYGASNRAALVRVPDAWSRHIEYRAADGTAHPYLLLAGLLAAGLDGIESELRPGEPVEDDIGHLTPQQFRERGLAPMPRTATEALDALEADGVLMDALGGVLGPGFLRVRRSEAATYALEVSDWERRAYLE